MNKTNHETKILNYSTYGIIAIFFIYIVLGRWFEDRLWFNIALCCLMFLGAGFILYFTWLEKKNKKVELLKTKLDLHSLHSRFSEHPPIATVNMDEEEDLYDFDIWWHVSDSMLKRPLELRIRKNAELDYLAMYLMAQDKKTKRIMATGSGSTLEQAVDELDQQMRIKWDQTK